MINKKKCIECGELKVLDQYRKTGIYRRNRCNECERVRARNYAKTIKGLIYGIYRHQKCHSIERGFPVPEYTRDELYNFIISQQNFKSLYDAWVLSNYNKDKTPSVDRIDDYGYYTIDNIQLITWRENLENCAINIKSGKNRKISKSVDQYSMDGDYIRSFFSLTEAGRVIGTHRGNIRACCKGKTSHAKGYVFKYSKQKQKKQ